MKDNVWCVRFKRGGYWLNKKGCLAAQSNPEVHCPKRCEQRHPPDDRGDAEKFYLKNKEV